jgi:hypothetical protein
MLGAADTACGCMPAVTTACCAASRRQIRVAYSTPTGKPLWRSSVPGKATLPGADSMLPLRINTHRDATTHSHRTATPCVPHPPVTVMVLHLAPPPHPPGAGWSIDCSHGTAAGWGDMTWSQMSNAHVPSQDPPNTDSGRCCAAHKQHKLYSEACMACLKTQIFPSTLLLAGVRSTHETQLHALHLQWAPAPRASKGHPHKECRGPKTQSPAAADASAQPWQLLHAQPHCPRPLSPTSQSFPTCTAADCMLAAQAKSLWRVC